MDRWLERALLAALLGYGVAALAPGPYAVAIDGLVSLALLAPDWFPRWAACIAGGAAVAEVWEPRARYLVLAAWAIGLLRSRTWSLALWLLSIGLFVPESQAYVLPVWIGFVAEAVFLRARPFEPYGRLARWRHPSWMGRPFDALANSRLFGALLEPLPEVTMRSDITDVVYVNYLVPAETVLPLVPPGLELQRLGPNGKYALFTFLTYRHGHFGFAFLGPFRRLLPSPVQTNWRIHVTDPRTKHRGIYFLTNAITSTVPALAARLTTEGMPMHVLAFGDVRREADGALAVRLDPGGGSAPDAEIALRPLPGPPVLSGPWAECWPDYRSFLAYCVPQDRAMSSQPLRGRVSRQEIDLGIPLDICAPVAGTVKSRAAAQIAAEAEPLCFYVPKVSFTFSVEAHDALGQNQ
ncbi:MAG: DUF2071 domain-containing protein [Labilithrix sp.]